MTKMKYFTVTILYIFYYITLQLSFMHPVRGNLRELFDEMTGNVSEVSGRFKRSPSDIPYVLKFRVRYPTGESIHLTWFHRNNFLANNHLPIFLPSGPSTPNVMLDIGSFITYHDNVKNSAVVYYRKTNTLSGFIGLDYLIMNLPYEFNAAGNYIGKEPHRYMSKRPYAPLHNLPPLPDTLVEEVFSSSDGPEEYPNYFMDVQPGTSDELRFKRDYNKGTHEGVIDVEMSKVNRRSRRWDPLREQYYLEVLVFITRDVADNYEKYFGIDKYIGPMLRDYINYFNAVDMVFRKLNRDHLKMYINIAQIVIEDYTEFVQVVNDVGELQFSETIARRRRFLNAHQNLYPQDSFDYVFISTSRPIKHDSNLVHGMTDMIGDLYNARKNNKWYSAVPITVMGFANDYSAAVHEIGRILHINVDSWVRGCTLVGQCYAIMQRGGSKCDNCLKWSTESREQFIEFFGRSFDRCFLLNPPRSLRPPGPSVFLTPNYQCQCYGFHSFVSVIGDMKQYVRSKDCGVPLKCKIGLTLPEQFENTINPMDGTKCSGSNDKVCWNGQCRYSPVDSCSVRV